MTVFSWFSPWEWPAWPALWTMRLAFGSERNFADLPPTSKALFFLLLIVINTAAWTLVIAALYKLLRVIYTSGRSGSPVPR